MLNQEKHRQILFNLLVDIYQSPAGSFLGFKGGTMFYFFFQLDRFSVDLDFDLLNKEKKELVYDEIRQILQKYGKIKDEAEKENTILFFLSYGEAEHNVKVEISKRSCAFNQYEINNFYGTDVRVLKLEDALAHKLVAALERKRVANRDFYDIFFFLKQGAKFNEDIIKTRTGKSKVEFLLNLRDKLDKKVSSRGVLEGLGELVDGEKKKWVKESLKKELLGLLDFLIAEERRG